MKQTNTGILIWLQVAHS